MFGIDDIAFGAIASAVIGGASSLFGSSKEVEGAQMTNAANAEEAAKNREWQTIMARENRAWQEEQAVFAHPKEVEGLKAAGLNPILSAGGSGAPVGSGGSVSSAQAHLENPYKGYGSAISSAAKLMTTEAQRSYEELQLTKLKQETEKWQRENLQAMRDANLGLRGKYEAEAMSTAAWSDMAQKEFLRDFVNKGKNLEADTLLKLQTGTMHSASKALYNSRELWQTLENKRRSVIAPYEPYLEAWKQGIEAGEQGVDLIWDASPMGKGMKKIPKPHTPPSGRSTESIRRGNNGVLYKDKEWEYYDN